MKNFQPDDSVSNAHVGRDFEEVARDYFLQTEGLQLQKSFAVDLGANIIKKRLTL